MQQYYGICRQKLHWALLQLINILRPEHNTGSSPEAEVVFTLDIMEIQKTPDPRASGKFYCVFIRILASVDYIMNLIASREVLSWIGNFAT